MVSDGGEDQYSVGAWQRETFGESRLCAVLAKYLEEVAELVEAAVGEGAVARSFMAACGVVQARLREIGDEVIGTGALVEELADNQIVLWGLAEACSADLETEVNMKMEVNRGRDWEQLGGGTGAHV